MSVQTEGSGSTSAMLSQEWKMALGMGVGIAMERLTPRTNKYLLYLAHPGLDVLTLMDTLPALEAT